jgi:hypothetical protein
MRSPILSLFMITAALLSEMQATSAQSPYSYPWCSHQTAGRGDTTSLLFHQLSAVHDDDFRHWRVLLPKPVLSRGAGVGAAAPLPALLIDAAIIAAALNERGIPTASGRGEWQPVHVRRARTW